MEVFIAVVTHGFGATFFAGKTEKEVEKKLLEYCMDGNKDFWEVKRLKDKSYPELEGNTDRDKIDYYFQSNMGHGEQLYEGDDEVPTWFDFFIK